MNKGDPQHLNQSPSQTLQSGHFENENYRLMYSNPYQPPMELPLLSLAPLKTCFLGFLQSGESVSLGPFIMNVNNDEREQSLKIVDLDLDFFDEVQYTDHNQTQTRIIRDIQIKLEAALDCKDKKLSSDSKSELKNLKQLRLKITPLPFDHFFINSVNKRSIASVDSGSQTISSREEAHLKDEDLISVLREQIQVLKDQNQLLRLQHDVSHRRSSSRPTREYVIRKQSVSTAKSTRNHSAASTDMVIETESVKSQKIPANQKTLTNLTLLTDENTSLQEMLQEYMLENEALRQHNNSLEELRASHHSELSNMSRHNKELSVKIDELSKKVQSESVSDRLPREVHQVSKLYYDSNREKEIRNYPITYERTDESTNNKTSYLRQYASMRNKLQNEIARRAPLPADTFVDNLPKTIPAGHISNDSLLEELSRIDVTIKDHIRKNQFNETLRNMGKRQSPRKN